MDLGSLLRTFDLGHSFGPMAVMPSIVEPAALVAGAGEDLVDRLPEPQGAIAHRHFRGHGQPTCFDINE